MSLLLLYDKLQDLDNLKSKTKYTYRIISSFASIDSIDEYLIANPINNIEKLYIVNNKIFSNDTIMNYFINNVSNV